MDWNVLKSTNQGAAIFDNMESVWVGSSFCSHFLRVGPSPKGGPQRLMVARHQAEVVGPAGCSWALIPSKNEHKYKG